MRYLPLERLLAIATGQVESVMVSPPMNAITHMLSVVSPTSLIDTKLAARMIANGLALALQEEVWHSRSLGTCGRVGETDDLRVILWMDTDEQPGIVAVWDIMLEGASRVITPVTVLPRPELVIGRNVRSSEHFVLRYVPGAWVERLQRVCFGVQRFVS